jgi:predicted DNA-binding WGR domain protein
MSQGIQVDVSYLSHESGTKFYEVVTLLNHDANVGVLIKRWGKIEVACERGGGEIKVETFSLSLALRNAESRAINDKIKRGYCKDDARHIGSRLYEVSGESLSAQSSVIAIDAHYGRHCGHVLFAARLVSSDGVTVDESADPNDIVCEEPPPEPERGGEWASW